jgi:chorismate-pyruvate lyase
LRANPRAFASVAEFWRLFPLNGLGPLPRWRLVGGETLPQPYRTLLVHHGHMTRVLEEHYRSKLDLSVLDRRRAGEFYARQVLLTVRKTGAPALLGIMRIDLRAARPRAREMILEEKTPLGAILIRHRVLRRIEPFAYLQIDPTEPMVDLLRISPPRPVYGRLATIHCGGAPAVDLCEVVAP